MHIVHTQWVDGSILAGVFLTSSFCVVPESSYSSNAAISTLVVVWSSNYSIAAKDVTGRTSAASGSSPPEEWSGNRVGVTATRAWSRAETWVHEADFLQKEYKCKYKYNYGIVTTYVTILSVVCIDEGVITKLTQRHIHMMLFQLWPDPHPVQGACKCGRYLASSMASSVQRTWQWVRGYSSGLCHLHDFSTWLPGVPWF